MYNFYMVKMFSIFKYNGSLYVRTGTDTARNIFTKNVSAFRSDAKVIIFDNCRPSGGLLIDLILLL